jgi:hypothetical protein
VRTKAAFLKPSGISIPLPTPPLFSDEGIKAFPPLTASLKGFSNFGVLAYFLQIII